MDALWCVLFVIFLYCFIDEMLNVKNGKLFKTIGTGVMEMGHKIVLLYLPGPKNNN